MGLFDSFLGNSLLGNGLGSGLGSQWQNSYMYNLRITHPPEQAYQAYYEHMMRNQQTYPPQKPEPSESDSRIIDSTCEVVEIDGKNY